MMRKTSAAVKYLIRSAFNRATKTTEITEQFIERLHAEENLSEADIERVRSGLNSGAGFVSLFRRGFLLTSPA